MRGMIYFIPNAKVVCRELLEIHGLQTLVTSAQSRETMRGPNDGPGLLVASGNLPADQMSFAPDRQTWKKRFGSDAWIGIDLDAPKQLHRDLLRDKQVRGQSIILSDGNAWLVPVLRSFDANQLDGPFAYRVNLERVLEQDPETGRMVPGDVIPQYEDVWEQALEIGDCLLKQVTQGANAATLDDELLEDFVANVLHINYRLHKPELSLLKLLTTETLVRVMQIAIDWDTLETNLKNRVSRLVSGGTNTESGETLPTEESTTKRTARRSRK